MQYFFKFRILWVWCKRRFFVVCKATSIKFKNKYFRALFRIQIFETTHQERPQTNYHRNNPKINHSSDKSKEERMFPVKCCFCVDQRTGVRLLGTVLVFISAIALVIGVIIINQVNSQFLQSSLDVFRAWKDNNWMLIRKFILRLVIDIKMTRFLHKAF